MIFIIPSAGWYDQTNSGVIILCVLYRNLLRLKFSFFVCVARTACLSPSTLSTSVMAAAVQVPITAPFSMNEPWQTEPMYVNENDHKHRQNICKPCIYTNRTVGCRRGYLCTFCHHPHKPSPRRPTKTERDKIKQIAKDCVDNCVQDPDFLNSLAGTSAYMAQVLDATRRAAGWV
jgi:hypothetical protein